MKKILLILTVFLVISSCAFALDIQVDGTTSIISDGRTLVPVRGIFESFGGKVDWNEKARKVTVWIDDNTIELTIDSKLASVNGVAKDLDVPAKIVNNRTLVPVRFISENCGLIVDWNAETKTVSINKPVSNSGEELIEASNSGEENIVITEAVPFYVQSYNEKFSKSFGENKSINSTYQLCEYIARNNMMNQDNPITVEYTTAKGDITSSSDYIVINEIKIAIIKLFSGRFDVSGEYGQDGYLNKVKIVQLGK